MPNGIPGCPKSVDRNPSCGAFGIPELDRLIGDEFYRVRR